MKVATAGHSRRTRFTVEQTVVRAGLKSRRAPTLATFYPAGTVRGSRRLSSHLRFAKLAARKADSVPERIPYAREPRKLPVVLSADEVVQFLEAVSSLKSRAALTTAYAAGLRASEVAGLESRGCR